MDKVFRSELEQVEKNGAPYLWREGDYVYRYEPDKLDGQWRQNMEQILGLWQIPGFVDFTDGGYITRYVNGHDLQGNRPFQMDGSKIDTVIPDAERHRILPMFYNAMKVGEQLGFTLGDMTCGNIFTDGQSNYYLIDYEVITEYPLNRTYLDIWNNTLHLIFKKVW